MHKWSLIDGITPVPWFQGLPLVWNSTCVDTLAPSHVRTGTVTAAIGVEQAKELKYRDLEGSYILQPIACKTLGSWDESSLLFLKHLSQ